MSTIGYTGPTVNSYQTTVSRTTINRAHAATVAGKITKVYLYFQSANASNVKIGTFYGSGASFTNRDYAIIDTVVQGSVQSFDVDIDVKVGDYIGVYWTTANAYLKLAIGGTNTRIYYAGDAFGEGAQNYTDWDNYYLFAYGEIQPSFNGLQKIPHDTTRYSKNPIELMKITDRLRIGMVGTVGKISPTMTANNAPSPYVVSADSEYAAENAAWKAMNGTNVGDSDCWTGADGTLPNCWWKIDFGSAVIATGYKLSGYYTANIIYPTAWTFEGSNDGTNFTTLDSQTGQVLTGSLSNLYSFSNTTAYRYYRIYITAGYGGFTRTAIGETEIYSSVIYHNYIGA